ncbi:hypothetical protein [Legionella maceachernii]|uniref:Dot/Icm T4SS effector n=1 Tax=Legionella maceachernii TaxID=466 RepID=A0A0W0W0L2_9GAMM|nr:hypothetical protein [Legionella maceachernii]KTD25809.1 Dot/Icm T4SS effector [Legionella maceachernii]SJZ46001.1 hypothetical protein SAMN02745128_00084 [Legionella maceachernii]SUP04036.1 Uncharacterised protein [Legionella maceachernii]
MRAKISGDSFDYDGSISPPKGLRGIDTHKPFLDSLKSKNKKYTATHVFINSKRQSVRDDKANAKSNENGSCYPVMEQISHYLEARFEKLLMPDIYNGLKEGETFDQAIQCLDEQQNYVLDHDKNVQFFPVLYDESKLSILLAQTKKLSAEYPDDHYEIDFYFYDDQKDILDALHQHLTQNRHLLCRRLNLILVLYPPITEGENLIEYEIITGTGETDHNWRQSIVAMAKDCIASRAYQEMDPCNPSTGTPIRSYEDARNAQFDLSINLNFIKHWQPGAADAEQEEHLSAGKEKSKREKKGLKSIFRSSFSLFRSKESQRTTTPLEPPAPVEPGSNNRRGGLFHKEKLPKRESETRSRSTDLPLSRQFL